MVGSDLSTIQSFMERALLRTAPLADDPEMCAKTPSMIAGNARLSPVEQLEIYREQYWLRHVGALEEDFESLVHLLGDDAFHGLARAYLSANPPDSYTLRDLGARLPAFVAGNAPYDADPLIADLARLEWAFVEAFDAPDAPPLDTHAIAAASEDDWAGAHVLLHPSVQRVVMEHPADVYRASARKGEAPVRPDKRRVYMIVYRGPESLQYIDIEPLAFALLERLAAGEPLASACERIADGADIEAQVGAWFQQWSSYGWIREVRFG